jgi:hypothetical protein
MIMIRMMIIIIINNKNVLKLIDFIEKTRH